MQTSSLHAATKPARAWSVQSVRSKTYRLHIRHMSPSMIAARLS
jgi:hypothetical protein